MEQYGETSLTGVVLKSFLVSMRDNYGTLQLTPRLTPGGLTWVRLTS